jgi:hypothetical protein
MEPSGAQFGVAPRRRSGPSQNRRAAWRCASCCASAASRCSSACVAQAPLALEERRAPGSHIQGSNLRSNRSEGWLLGGKLPASLGARALAAPPPAAAPPPPAAPRARGRARVQNPPPPAACRERCASGSIGGERCASGLYGGVGDVRPVCTEGREMCVRFVRRGSGGGAAPLLRGLRALLL